MQRVSEEHSEANDNDKWPLDFPPPPRGRGLHRAVLGALLLSSASLVVLARTLEPDPRGFGTHEQLGFDPCQMLAATGVPCPGCGVTTSITLALRGRVVDSFMAQPLGLALAIGVPGLSLLALTVHACGGDVYRTFETRRAPWLRLGICYALIAWAFNVFV
ncbi:MAG: hypothetical protein ACI9F9_000047 [Candidatus Paceibacteria bacterium]|jgi:hypothetical protein